MRRLYNLSKNIIFSNLIRLPFPYKLTFILTYKCNFRCKMCNIWNVSNNENELTFEEVEKFFRHSNRFCWINLSGGEIFLRPDLFDIIKTIHRNCKNLFLLDFPTNGFFKEKIVDTVEIILRLQPAIKKILVTISLDGPSELHTEIRGIKNSWDRAVDTFKELKKIKNKRLGVFFGYTLMQYNVDKITETYNSVREVIGDIKYDDFHVNLAQVSRHYYNNVGTINIDKRVVINSMNEFIKKRGNHFNPVFYLEHKYQKLLKPFLESERCPLRCMALSASCFIDPYWNVYPCIMFDKKIGNLHDYDFDLNTLWMSFPVRNLQEEIIKGNCPNCWTPCEAYQAILGNLFR